MNWKTYLAKNMVSIITTAGVGTVVENVIKKTTPEDISRIQKIGIKIGSLVIGAMVSEKVEEFTVSKFDELHNTITKIFHSKKEDILIESSESEKEIVEE